MVGLPLISKVSVICLVAPPSSSYERISVQLVMCTVPDPEDAEHLIFSEIQSTVTELQVLILTF